MLIQLLLSIKKLIIILHIKYLQKWTIAFLPISKQKLQIVYSDRGNKNIDLENLIKKYNPKY